MSTPPTRSLITLSYSGDLEVCALLCRSVDRHVSEAIAHTLYVPRKDIPAFKPFASSRRHIIAQEELLPRWFFKLPMPGAEWRRRLRLPRRNVYLTTRSLPVRGWIAQQIMKIQAACSAQTDIVVHVDSDNAFIRPFNGDALFRDGKVRLYRNPERIALPGHQRWHEAAGRLLGLEPQSFQGAEYIDQIVVWKRDVARALVARIASVGGREWQLQLARSPHFAEYILYGVFADRVMGLDAAGLFGTDETLCLSRWEGGFATAADQHAFIASLQPRHVAVLLQSTIAMDAAARQAVFEKLEQHSAASSAG